MSAQPIATGRSASGIPTGRLATWWVIASEIVIFGGLLGSYIMFRLLHDAWSIEAAHTNVIAGSINTFILLTSSLSIVLAHRACTLKQYDRAYKFLWGTVLGGCCFLVVKSLEWTKEIEHGFTITRSLFWSFYYTAAGLHALHVIAGIVIMIILSFDLKKGKNAHRIELIGNYWHFVDIVWIFLFPLLYIAK